MVFFRPELPEWGSTLRGLGGSKDPPRPYVIRQPEPRTLGDRGGVMRLDVVLFGHGSFLAPFVLTAVEDASRGGIGRQGTRFRIDEIRVRGREGGGVIVDQQRGGPYRLQLPEPDDLAAYAERRWRTLAGDGQEATHDLRLLTTTPVRMKRDQRFPKPEPGLLLASILQRLSNLAVLYGDAPEQDHPFEAWKAQLARAVEEGAIRLYSNSKRSHRYSYANRAEYPMNGHELALEASVPRELARILLVSEITHIGSSTTMGMGQVEVRARVDE